MPIVRAGSSASSTHVHAAADIVSGVIAPVRLGVGAANTTTFLRGDQAYADPSLLAPPVHAIGNSGTALTINVSSAVGWVKTITLTGNCTITLTGAIPDRAVTAELYLAQDATGGRTVTWPTAVRWPGTAPVLSTAANVVDRISLTSYDGGLTWYGDLLGKGYVSGGPGGVPAYAWWQAGTLNLTDGAAVSSWTDSTGAFPAAQGAAGNRPTYQTNELNGLPVVRFDGTDDYLTTSASAGLAAQTLFAVVRPSDVVGGESIFGSSVDGGLHFRIASGGAPELVKQNTAAIGTSTTTITTAAFWIVAATFTNAGNAAFYVNGTAAGTGTHAQTLAASTLQIGRNGGNSEFFAGDIAELIVFNSVLSGTDLTAVYTYLNTKYNVGSSGGSGGTGGITLTGTTYFSETFASGGFGNFAAIHNAPSGGEDNTPGTYDQSTYHLKVVNVGGDRGNVARFEVRNGDTFDNGSTERCELLLPTSSRVFEGDERWYQFDIRYGDPTWNNTESWELNFQWHHSGATGSPPLCFQSQTNGTVQLRQPGLNGNGDTLWTIVPGQWERITVHAKFSLSPTGGFVRIWRNDNEVLPLSIRRTLLDTYSYVKCGIYRDGASTNTQVVMIDNIKITSSATLP